MSEKKGKRSSSKDKRQKKSRRMVGGFTVTDYNSDDDKSFPLAPTSLKKKTKKSKSKGGGRSVPLPGEGPSSSSSSMLSGPSVAPTSSSLIPPERIKVEPRPPQAFSFPYPVPVLVGGRVMSLSGPGEGPSSLFPLKLSGSSDSSTSSSVLPPARIKVEPRSPQGGPSSRFPLPYTGKGSKSKGSTSSSALPSTKRIKVEPRSPQPGPSSMFPLRIKEEPRSPQAGSPFSSGQRIKVERRSPQAESSMSGLAYSVPSAAAEKVGRKRKSATVLPPRARLPRAAKDLPPLHYSETRRRAAARPRPTTTAQAVRQLKEELLTDAFREATQSVAASRAGPSSLRTTVTVEPPSSSESSDCVLVSWDSPPKKGPVRRR
ncbi:putative protein TPRXL [Bradysia coprophila]|uniref:putative protein TPRXL n=1 Tax=Bradysia coprophila TaxID=38358 RepID=UPI00187DDA4B|nr:putative protein TPRXL [Bradysia coprophila]